MKQMKYMPLPSNVGFADTIGIIRKTYSKNKQGNDCDFTVAFFKDGKIVKREEHMDMHFVMFEVCRYLWYTSQPIQCHTDPEEDETSQDGRFEEVAGEL